MQWRWNWPAEQALMLTKWCETLIVIIYLILSIFYPYLILSIIIYIVSFILTMSRSIGMLVVLWGNHLQLLYMLVWYCGVTSQPLLTLCTTQLIIVLTQTIDIAVLQFSYALCLQKHITNTKLCCKHNCAQKLEPRLHETLWRFMLRLTNLRRVTSHWNAKCSRQAKVCQFEFSSLCKYTLLVTLN